MRLAVVTAFRGIAGGKETYLRWLMPALVERGHELMLIYEREALDAKLTIDRDVALRHVVSVAAGGLEQLREFRPDVVFAQGSLDAQLDVVLAHEFDLVLFAHGYYAACATGQKRHRFPSRVVCERAFGPACLALNYARQCGMLSPSRLVREYRHQSKRQPVLGSARRVVVASRHMRDVFIREGVPPERICVLPLPPLEFAPLPAPPERAERSNRLLFMGRLTLDKGIEQAVVATASASKQLGRKLTLDVAGVGPAEERCRTLARDQGLALSMHGWVDGENKLRLLQCADVLLVPSLWPEPFGLVGIEAACVGVPAVGYLSGGITDWLRVGETGEAPEVGDLSVEGLTRAIVRALEDPDHHARLARGAWQMSHEFSPQRHLSELEAILTRREHA